MIGVMFCLKWKDPNFGARTDGEMLALSNVRRCSLFLTSPAFLSQPVGTGLCSLLAIWFGAGNC
jgi:hypothetical protein